MAKGNYVQEIKYKTEVDAYKHLLDIFSIAEPFCRLNESERRVLAWIYYYYNNRLPLDKPQHAEIANSIGTKMNAVYVRKSALKDKGFLNEDSYEPRYKIGLPQKLEFRFVAVQEEANSEVRQPDSNIKVQEQGA